MWSALKEVYQSKHQMYYKVTNQDECHLGFQYHDGLNVDTLPFEPEGSCVPGGLYFTDSEHLSKYYRFGRWIRLVTLPRDEPGFQVVRDPSGTKWRANMLTLGRRLDMADPATYAICGSSMLDVDVAFARGYLEVVKWWKDDCIVSLASGSFYHAEAVIVVTAARFDLEARDVCRYISAALDAISVYGHVHILEWWCQEPGLDMRYSYSEKAMDYASLLGHVHVLQWWKESGLDLRYTSSAMDWASRAGHVDVLEWWRQSGLEVRYTRVAIDEALNDDVLRWWIAYGRSL